MSKKAYRQALPHTNMGRSGRRKARPVILKRARAAMVVAIAAMALLALGFGLLL